MIRKALYVLLILGVIRGVIRYNETTGSTGIERIITAIIDAVADITYRWLPALLDLIGGVLTAVAGG